MVKRKMYWVFGIVILGALGYCGWYFYHLTTPEAKIRQVLQELADCASKAPGDGGASTVLKVHRCPELFTDPAKVDVVGTAFRGEISNAQIQSHLARYRSSMERAHVSVDVESVRLTGEKIGEIILSGSLQGRTKSGTQISEVRDLYCELVLGDDGQWRIRQLSIRDILEK